MKVIRGYSVVLLSLLYIISPSSAGSETEDSSEECNSCSIYILDLASFAHTHGYPVCDLNKVVVDPTTGVVYLKEKDTGIHNKTSHKFGTHSAPWYLRQVSLCNKLVKLKGYTPGMQTSSAHPANKHSLDGLKTVQSICASNLTCRSTLGAE